MRKTWKNYLAAVIIALTAGIILWIYPFQKIALIPTESNYGKGEVFGSGNITEGTQVVQSFEADRSKLMFTSIYMQNLQETKEGSLIATLEKDGAPLKRVEIPLAEIENYEWYPIEWKAWLPEKGIYTISLTTDAPDEEILQTFVTVPNNGPSENREYLYDNQTVADTTLALNYQYVKPAGNLSEAAPFAAMAVLIGALLFELVCMIGGKKHA